MFLSHDCLQTLVNVMWGPVAPSDLEDLKMHATSTPKCWQLIVR